MSQNSLHIEFEKLTDLITGKLSDAERAEIAAHLIVCADCATTKTRAEKFVGIMRSDLTEEVPSHILERSFDLLRERKPTAEKTPLLKRIFAVLENESSSLRPAFGLRSGQPEKARRLWLTADEAEIDLRLEETGENWNITGQVFGSFVGGTAVLRNETTTREAEMSDLCEFSLTNVPKGVYQLILHFVDTEIEISQVSVGE